MRLLLRSRRALALDSVSVGSVPASPRAFHLALRDARLRIAPVVWSTRLKCPLRVENSAATRPCMSASRACLDMSAKCHKRTHALQQTLSLFDAPHSGSQDKAESANFG